MTDAVIEFAKWVIREGAFQAADLDGLSIQEKALELGLLTRTSYDPEKHGEDEYAEPGSDWYVFSNLLTQTDPSPAQEAQQEPPQAAAQADYERIILSALEPAAPESEPRPMTGFFSNLSPEGQAAALAYDGPEPNIGDTAPEGQQEAAAWQHIPNCGVDRESKMVHVTGKVFCDPCIEPLVAALNAAGIETVASCCGHGHRPGVIALRDGRELVIVKDFEEARKVDAAFPTDINGDARPSEQAVTEAWRPIETAPKDGNKILAWTPAGLDLVWWSDLEPDGPQEPGHNPGWWGASGETAPGRTPEHGFSGNPSYHWPAQNQPTHWMPLPTPPTAGGGDE